MDGSSLCRTEVAIPASCSHLATLQTVLVKNRNKAKKAQVASSTARSDPDLLRREELSRRRALAQQKQHLHDLFRYVAQSVKKLGCVLSSRVASDGSIRMEEVLFQLRS